MLNLILASIAALVVTSFMAFLAFSLYRQKFKVKALESRLNVLLNKDPLEFDLELATTTQLLTELRKRPQPQYLLLLPQFEPQGIALQMEVHNLPPNIALGLLKMAHKLAAQQQNEGEGEMGEFTEFPHEDAE